MINLLGNPKPIALMITVPEKCENCYWRDLLLYGKCPYDTDKEDCLDRLLMKRND